METTQQSTMIKTANLDVKNGWIEIKDMIQELLRGTQSETATSRGRNQPLSKSQPQRTDKAELRCWIQLSNT